jgi:hypothetical protein
MPARSAKERHANDTMQKPDVRFLVLGFVILIGFHYEIFRVQIQKEAIAHWKRENQFLSKVIWESTYMSDYST